VETAVRKVLEFGFRTPDLARANPHGYTVLSTTAMGSKVRETIKTQLLATSH
jgi:3-isopropylmalate dehydrogenase